MDWNGFSKRTCCGDTGVMGVTGVGGATHWYSALSVAGRFFAIDVPSTRVGAVPVLGRIRRSLLSLDDDNVGVLVVNLRTKCSDKPSIAVETRKGGTVPAAAAAATSLLAGLGVSTVEGRSGKTLSRDPGSKFKLCDGL